MSGYRFMDGITEYRNNAGKDRTTEGQGESSIAPLFQSGAIMIVINNQKINYPVNAEIWDIYQ